MRTEDVMPTSLKGLQRNERRDVLGFEGNPEGKCAIPDGNKVAKFKT